MDILELKVTKRSASGKKHAKQLRREKKIPAVYYKKGEEALSLELVKKELFEIISKHGDENILVNIFADNDKPRTALISDMQIHPVSDEILHVDFHGVSMDEKITVSVAIHAEGEPEGVSKGGVLDIPHREIEIECLPTNIPEAITVDVSQLDIGDNIHVEDIQMPEGVVCKETENIVLFNVSVPQVEEEKTEAEGEEEEASAEPEVIKKGKEEDSEESSDS